MVKPPEADSVKTNKWAQTLMLSETEKDSRVLLSTCFLPVKQASSQYKATKLWMKAGDSAQSLNQVTKFVFEL